MEIQEIRYFVALCETLNFTRAAERCNVSQPSLTRAIRNLEEKLGGGPLVHRERDNTHLTELGRMLRPYLEQVLAELDAAREKARGYAQLTDASLRVGLMCTIGPTRLVGLFSEFHRRFPAVQLQLRDGKASELQDQLLQGELDIAIYCRPEPLGERFHLLPLYRERFVVAIAPDHPFAERNAVSFKDLHGEPYLDRSNCEYAEHIDAILERLGVEPSFPYESERDDWIQSMVLAGLGCTSIPEFAITVPGLVTRPLVEPSVHRTVNLVTVRGRPHSPAVGAFVLEAKRYPWQEKLKGASAGDRANLA
jgi:DNA-binding transcriptional LysR family regulator